MSHDPSRRSFLKSLCHGAAAMTFAGCAGATRRNQVETSAGKPNIVLMFVDNIGYGDLGCYGNKVVRTPRIDRFAREGVRCTDFYIGSPSCMPSRGALLTGRHGVRNGLNEQLWRTDELEQVALPHSEKILPRYLAEAGYVSGCFGKWNLGFIEGSRPTDRGF
ncbi:MAG: twin-arginine translocation signal domain-containing protein, partial [Planctomycetota bacterium]